MKDSSQEPLYLVQPELLNHEEEVVIGTWPYPRQELLRHSLWVVVPLPDAGAWGVQGRKWGGEYVYKVVENKDKQEWLNSVSASAASDMDGMAVQQKPWPFPWPKSWQSGGGCREPWNSCGPGRTSCSGGELANVDQQNQNDILKSHHIQCNFLVCFLVSKF